MKIFVFTRPDGSAWADYADLGGRDGHKRVAEHEFHTRADMEALIASPGEVVPERVRALAERSLAEHVRSIKPIPVTRQQNAVMLAQLEQWGLWRRMKWLATGK